MYHAIVDTLEHGRLDRYEILRNGRPLTYRQVLERLGNDSDFQTFFTRLMVDSRFDAFRWETPAVSQILFDRKFEFVLWNASEFTKRVSDKKSFAKFFVSLDRNHGIVSFKNLSGDATLIVPSPTAEELSGDCSSFGHLAAFLRNTPAVRSHALWETVSHWLTENLTDQPVWLSTAGGGVAWLHVRMDRQPKYYRHQEYKTVVRPGEFNPPDA